MTRIRETLDTIPDLARWLAVAGWMALIFRISALQGGDVPGRFGTLGHFIGYAALGVLLAFALISRFDRPRALALAVLLGSTYGVTDEFHQSFVPGRTPDIADWGVDTLGVLVGAWVLLRIIRGR